MFGKASGGIQNGQSRLPDSISASCKRQLFRSLHLAPPFQAFIRFPHSPSYHSLWHNPCDVMFMKMKLFAISMASAALLVNPVRADDKDKDLSDRAGDKVSELNRKTHDKVCKGQHGSVTAKTDTSISIDGKMYALVADTRVNKQEEPLLPKTVKSGDHVCFVTEKASDGSEQISKVMAVDKDSTRVREKDSDSPKIEVQTPNKKIEVK